MKKTLELSGWWHGGVDSHEKALYIQERAMATATVGITIADASQPDCPLIYCNGAFTEITGYLPEDVLGFNCRFLQGPDTDPEVVDTLRLAIKAGEACTVVFKNYRKDKSAFWNQLSITPVHNSHGKLSHFIGVQHDVTARKEAEAALGRGREELERANRELEMRVEQRTKALQEANAQLRYDAFYDGLTGLANRALFNDRLTHALEREKRDSRSNFAVLFLDLDRFKIVNDSLGHSVGDSLLKAVAVRLKSCLRPTDTIARLGSDEFVILFEDLLGLEELQAIVDRIQIVLAKALDLEGRKTHVSASMGIVCSDNRYNDAEEILRDADTAMCHARELGKARHVYFDSSMRERALSALALEMDLRLALEQEALTVHYQPVVDAETCRVKGFEALVRWEHPDYGAISPAEFIPIAEETELIIGLDRFVLKEACKQVALWQQEFQNPDLSLSVNLSSQQLLHGDLTSYVANVIFETGFDAKHLRLELTESIMINLTEHVQTSLRSLKFLGLQLHIDDFGTGYSSLSYLATLPCSTLKIDRSFVNQMRDSSESEGLVRGIIQMAHNLNLDVIAEGVESAEQWELLRSLGCEYLQGYFFSRPLAKEDVVEFMNRNLSELVS